MSNLTEIEKEQSVICLGLVVSLVIWPLCFFVLAKYWKGFNTIGIIFLIIFFFCGAAGSGISKATCEYKDRIGK